MNTATLAAAVSQAKRFIKTAEAQQAEQQKQMRDTKSSYVSTPLENGAVKRASMDLTRALAVLRRPS